MIRVYPQRSFSLAILMTRAAISAAVFGLPCPRCWLPSYFLATSSRYQRKIVSGDAMVATVANPFRPNAFPRVASLLRSASVNLTLLGPSFFRRSWFSALR
jgi:hypothetical protein